MRILHYVWSTNFGGIERLTLDLAQAQKACSGHHVGVMVGQDQGEFSDQFQSDFDAFHSLDLKSGFDRDKSKQANARDYASTFDVIHMHTFNPLVARVARGIDCAVIYTEHGNFGFGRKRTFADRVKGFLRNGFLKKHVDHITFNSAFTRAEAERRYSIAAVPRDVVYNGIDLNTPGNPDDIDPSIKQRIEGKFVVGTTTRFAGFKRIDRLIEGFAKFQSDSSVVLLLVGDGPLRNQLETQVREAGIESNVVFTGFQGGVANYQVAMDICVFPSRHEPFGLVAVETLRMGKPTIVFSDGGGIVEIVDPVTPEDVVNTTDSLADRMRYYRNAPDQSSMAERRKNRALQFNIESMATAMDSIYESAMKRHSDA